MKKLITTLFMLVIVLHNSEDKDSISLVKNLPTKDGNTYVVVDWYKTHCQHNGKPCDCINGEAYKGPDPSAFPELVFYDATPPDLVQDNGKGGTITTKVDPAWARVRKAQSVTDIQDRTKLDARKADVTPPVEAAAQTEDVK